MISPKSQRWVTFPSLPSGSTVLFWGRSFWLAGPTPKPLSSAGFQALSYLIFQSLSCWDTVLPSIPLKQAQVSTVQRLSGLTLVRACKHLMFTFSKIHILSVFTYLGLGTQKSPWPHLPWTVIRSFLQGQVL